nr:pollen-specific leucine-rich repeat extensin-like protein 4 [Ipomoea batatas]GMC72877.1 pollen-specific leucine-rich repeat extensin-like protein 4 [Ipomoea batatas]
MEHNNISSSLVVLRRNLLCAIIVLIITCTFLQSSYAVRPCYSDQMSTTRVTICNDDYGEDCRTEYYYTSCNHRSDPSPRAGAPPTPFWSPNNNNVPMFRLPPPIFLPGPMFPQAPQFPGGN